MDSEAENSSDQAWSPLSEQLDHALELSEAERQSWLTDLREREPELAAKLEQFLRLREREGFAEFLRADAEPIASLKATLIGRQIGAYRVEAEVGRGGMGSVWRARRIDGRYEGIVAIKLVHASWLGHAAEQRFQIEGQLLGRLEHVHIARLLDAGVLDGMQPYLVLEYVEGLSIDEYCRQHGLGIHARIRLFLDVLEAVAHAHSHLIVHRDLKPGNIFVTRDGVVKLLDFGIAKLLQGSDTAADLTQSGQVALTPQFAAPEQLTGQEVTTRTDIYTLGVVLFVLLTGSHPFSPAAELRENFIQAVLTQEPSRPSTVATLETISRRMLKGDLDNILRKALKKRPLERYVSVTDFADDLKRLLNHEPVRAHADTVHYRFAKFVRRHQGSVLGALLTTVTLIGTTAFAVRQMLEARAQRDRANFEAARSSAQSELNEFLLGDSLGQVPQDVAARRLERARAMIQQRFADEPLVQARLLINLSGRYIDLGNTHSGAELMREAQTIAAKLDDPDLNADIACGRAEDAVDAGDLSAAHAQEAIARANLRRMNLTDSGLMAECAMSAANIAQFEGEYPRAIAVTADAMLALEREGLKRTSRYTSIAHEHARSLVLAGNFREGWSAEQSVMSIVASVGRENSGAYFAMLNVASGALLYGGQPRRAVELLATAESQIKRSTPDAELPYFLHATRLLAESATGLAPMADEGLMEDAMTAEQEGVASLVLQYRIGALRAALDRGAVVAAEHYWSSLGTAETSLADAAGRRNAVRVLVAHASLELARHEVTAASQHIGQATQLVPEARRGNDPEWRKLLLERVQIEYALAQYPAAAADAQALVSQARQEAVDPNSSAWIGEALVWRAKVELARGNGDAAKASAKEALSHLRHNLSPSHPLCAAAQEITAAAT